MHCRSLSMAHIVSEFRKFLLMFVSKSKKAKSWMNVCFLMNRRKTGILFTRVTLFIASFSFLPTFLINLVNNPSRSLHSGWDKKNTMPRKEKRSQETFANEKKRVGVSCTSSDCLPRVIKLEHEIYPGGSYCLKVIYVKHRSFRLWFGYSSVNIVTPNENICCLK